MTTFGSLRPVRSEHSEPQPEPISEYAPRPAPGPREIGEVTLDAIEQIFEGPARLLEAAVIRMRADTEERATRFTELAHRLRQRGLHEREELAKDINIAVTADQTAAMLLDVIRDRYEPQPEAPAPTPVDLDAIAAEIGEVKEEAGR